MQPVSGCNPAGGVAEPRGLAQDVLVTDWLLLLGDALGIVLVHAWQQPILTKVSDDPSKCRGLFQELLESHQSICLRRRLGPSMSSQKEQVPQEQNMAEPGHADVFSGVAEQLRRHSRGQAQTGHLTVLCRAAAFAVSGKRSARYSTDTVLATCSVIVVVGVG